MGGACSTKSREENVYSFNMKTICFKTTFIGALRVQIHTYIYFLFCILSVRNERDTVKLLVGRMSTEYLIMASLFGKARYGGSGK
jgi:hypothetical protein